LRYRISDTKWELLHPAFPSLAGYAPLASPTFTGTPTAPTAVGGTNTTQLATTAFVQSAVSGATSVVTVKRQTFSANGTYTPSAGMLYADIEVWGAGGGGGGVNATNGAAGGGGGAGGYSREVVTAATVGASQAVTIGTGGTAGANTGGTGGTGGTTSVGSILQATGGAGGVGNTSVTTSVSGGAGGVGSSGEINLTGNRGSWGIAPNLVLASVSGTGGTTSLGGAGMGFGGNTSTAGNSAVANSGSGGSGALSAGAAAIGGVGGSGYVIITEYCSQ
jgi:hypothetical protein